MELRQLKYFIKAAELQNFTEAANLSFITQSTLSQQIKQLEDELGILLFNRLGKRVRLTEAGQLFLPYAQKTVKDAQDGRDILKDLMNLETGTLSIGVTYGLTHLLTKAIEDFNVQYPNVKLHINFGTTSELLANLELGKVDMVLSFLPVKKNSAYQSQNLFSSSLSLIAHNDHPCAKIKQIKLKDLETLPLLLPSAGYSIRNYFDKLATKHNLNLSGQMEVNDINMLLQLVNTGKWCTVLMATSISQYTQLKAVKITGDGMNREATITWAINTYQKKAALSMADCLQKHANEYDK